jgi:group I intron endonuclease
MIGSIISTPILNNNVPAMIGSSGYVTSHRRADMNILTYKQSGIYKITNTVNGKIYIGSAVDLKKRWGRHVSNLNLNINKSKKLQAAWNKYGQDCFVFTIIEYCEKDKLIEREQYYIDTLRPEYNILQIAGSSLGYKHTPENVKRNSENKKGNKYLLGFIFSAESRAKMSQSAKNNKSHLGHKHTPEVKARLSALLKGRIISDETRAKMSAARKGKPCPRRKGKK